LKWCTLIPQIGHQARINHVFISSMSNEITTIETGVVGEAIDAASSPIPAGALPIASPASPAP
jgi:hypothetical protein